MNNIQNKAIKVKLANLISTTPRDMCIRARINNYCFDLSKFFSDEQLSDFFSFKTDRLELSSNVSKAILKSDLEAIETSKEFFDYLDANEILLAKTRKEKLTKKFDKYKQQTIELIISKADNQKNKIKKIIKNSKNIADNTGIFSLYAGSYFLVGNTVDNIQINAPLILYPMEVFYEKDTCVIRHTNGNKFVVNEKLLNLLKKNYNFKPNITDFAKNIRETSDLDALFNEIKKVLPVSNESIDGLNIVDFVNMPDYLGKTNFTISRSYVLGIFEPTGGALKYDLEKLIEMDLDPFVNKQTFSKTRFINEEVDNKPLVSMDGKLNIYQKYAIRSALMQNTLIFGPPGTGKSEVITNIIANALIARKSTLVVAEKRVALDVIMERLQDLASFTLFIDDLKNKSEFYDKIKWIADQLDNMYYDQNDVNHDSYLTKIDTTYIDKSHSELKNYFSALYSLVNYKDSNQTSFLEYLSLNKAVNANLLKFVKDNNSLDYINRMLALYSFRDINTLFEKINEYKDFLTNYKINVNQASGFLKHQKLALTEFQIHHNTLNFLESYGSQVKSLLKEFANFLENSNLLHDKKFLNILKNNPILLRNQKMLLDQIKNNYYQIFNISVLKYLIHNATKVSSFLNRYNRKSKQTQEEYLLTFLKNTNFFKIVNVDKTIVSSLEVYVQIMSAFDNIPENHHHYLLNLFNLKNDEFLDQNVILLHFNSWLNEAYVKSLGETNLTFFSAHELTEFAPISHMTAEECEKIKKIVNFEQEIINNSNWLNVDLQQLVNQYRNDILACHENVVKKLAQQYLQSLKQILLKMDEVSKKKIQELFAIARREVKGNVPIKEIISNYYNELKLVFPIWISLPELIAQLLPLKQSIFDYGIFDEASQIFMERAYPIVYRCKINIVAGDDKQLKPTSFFTNRIDDAMQEYAYNDNDQVESLLDRAKVALWPEYNLRNHYRSNHRDLIQFSNDFIYDKNLHFVTKNGVHNDALEVINVEGANSEGINEVEAEVIFELLKDNINKYEKIIVVTFGSKQSNFIEQLIQKNSVECPEVNNKYTSGELIVSNLENAQGNEADLVILSVTYGKNQFNNFKNTFGPLLLEGGSNRLNVAVTRAKEKMIVVKSFLASEMTFNQENANARILRSFINYCDNISHNQQQHKIIKTNPNVSSLIHHDLQELFEKHLIGNNKYFLVKNYDIGSKIIDFAILDKSTNKTVFALLVNKLSFDSNVNSLFESVDNYWFINDRGYNCYILDEHYWIKNKAIANKKILGYLKSI